MDSSFDLARTLRELFAADVLIGFTLSLETMEGSS
jgi:hypothetical protein